MTNRNVHVGKSQQEKDFYGRYIKSLDYEPTLDESIDFASTEKAGEELSESSSKRAPRGRLKYNLVSYFSEHWLEWVIGALVIISLFLINESRITTTIMSKNIEDTNKNVDEVTTDIKEINTKVNVLEMKSALLEKDIEYLKLKK